MTVRIVCAWLAAWVVLPIPISGANSTRALSQFTHTAWTAKDGIPGPVRAIAQTQDGYLWFGTGAGLYHFDGVRFVLWQPAHGEHLPADCIEALHSTKDGSLWIGCGAALCVLAGIGILWLAYRMRLKQVTERVQDRLYERVAERTRIARDLHDNFFQGIQGLFLRFHTATSQLPQNEPARLIFENALRQSDDVMKEGRELLLNLRCTAGDKRDLPSALAEVGRQFQEVHPCEFKVIMNGKPCALHPIVCDELSQIGKQALSNAFRHSQASLIEAEVHFEPNQLRIRIRDDGEGIDPRILEQGHRSGHWGLPGMRERAKKIGAQIDVWSQAGAGTEVELTIVSRLAYASEENTISTSWFRRLWRSKKSRAERPVLG